MNDLIDIWKWYDSTHSRSSYKSPWIKRIIKAKNDNNLQAAIYAVKRWREQFSVTVINYLGEEVTTFYFKTVIEVEQFASVIAPPWLVIRGKH